MRCQIETVAKGNAFEMGVAQGQAVREKIHEARAILSRLYAFRSLQPRWMPYFLYRTVAEFRSARMLDDPLMKDFHDAHDRMAGISRGANIPLRLLSLLQVLEPMLSDVSRCSATHAIGGCSAVAVRGTR